MTLWISLISACGAPPPAPPPEPAVEHAEPPPVAPRSKELARPADPAVGTLPPGIGVPPGQPAPDAAPVMVSVDRVSESAKTSAAWTVPFPILSDPDLAAHEAFGVVHEADEAEVERLRGFGMDIEAASGKTHHRFAIPSMFLVDRKGVVRWAHADLDYKVRPSPAQVLAAIDAALPSR